MDIMATLEYYWMPLWFAFDILGTLGILYMVRRWVFASVIDTKDQVVAELKKPEVSEAVGEAMAPVISRLIGVQELRKDVAEFGAKIDGILPSVNGMKGVEAKAEKALVAQFLSGYQQSQYSGKDAEFIFKGLVKAGIPPGMAEYAARLGPSAARYALESTLGKSQAGKIWDAFQQGMNINIQGPQGPRGYQ